MPARHRGLVRGDSNSRTKMLEELRDNSEKDILEFLV